MDNFWIFPILGTIVAVTTGWVLRSRESIHGHSESSIVISSGEDERAAAAFQRLNAFNKLTEKFVKEVKEKISRKFGDQKDERVDSVLERVKRLEDLLKQNVSFSEEHINAFISIWRETLTLGVKFSQELKILKDKVKGLEETIVAQGTRIAGQQIKIDAQQKTNEAQVRTNEAQRRMTERLVKEVEELRIRADKFEALSGKLRYSEWISRMNELSASLLGMSWDDLGNILKSERDSHPQNPWVVEGSMHEKFYEEVLKSKLFLDISTWDLSRSYQGQRNREVHNPVIKYSEGDILRHILLEDFQNLKFLNFTSPQKLMLGEILRVLYRHYFRSSIDKD